MPGAGTGSAPMASVVIPAYSGTDPLASCLAALAENVPASIDHEVVVVLNGERVAWTPELAAVAPNARVVESPVNLGFAGGCNLGAAVARGDHLVFLNDDARVRPGWLEALLRTARLRPDAGAIGSRLETAGGTVVEAGAVVFSNGYTYPAGAGDEATSPEWDFVREVDYCSAASLLVRRQAWEVAGGFDEEYHPAYCEDCDLCFRLQSLGYQVLYEPRSRVVHVTGAAADLEFRQFMWRRNHARFIARWPERLRSQGAQPVHDDYVPAAVELSSARARAARRPVLVVADHVPNGASGSAEAAQHAVRSLAKLGCAVTLAPVNGPAHTTDELRDLGVRVVADVAEHMRRPEILFDAAILIGPGPLRLAPVIRRLQPVAAVVAVDADTREPDDHTIDLGVGRGTEGTARWSEALSEALERRARRRGIYHGSLAESRDGSPEIHEP
jgi:GT2 family glycosyltransferase